MNKIFVSILILAFSILPGFSQSKITPSLEKKADQKKMTQWVDSVFNSLTPDQRIGQLITVITTSENTEAKRNELLKNIQNQHIGGIIFLKGTPQNQAALTNLCQKSTQTPLLISIDGEWGLSMRLSNTTRFPKNMMLGAIREDSLLYDYGKEMARQCKAMGIHINYAPVMDVNSNEANPVIGIRSYGENPIRVAKLGVMYSKGLEAGGVMSVAKHFPGHGDTSTDSHYTLPVVLRTREQLNSVELIPFREYIDAGLSGMMIGHLNIPYLDASKVPSSLSKSIVTDLLQTQLGFTGLIFSDGLAMKGVSDEPDMSVRLILAGNDVLLGPISPQKEFNAIKTAIAKGTLTQNLIDEKCKKILKWKYILGATSTDQIDTKALDANLNTSKAELLSRKLNEKAITLVKNEKEILPLNKLDKRSIAVVSVGGSKGNTFQRTLALYDNIEQFAVADGSGLSGLKSSLAKYNTVIVAIHSNKKYSDTAIQSICQGKNNILVFFATPYAMNNYQQSVAEANGIVIGYEDTPYANEYAAQAIFGGNKVDGILPVSAGGFKEGTSLKTNKERLSYSLPEEVGIPSEQLAAVDRIVQDGLNQKAYPGCQVLVAKDGVVIYNESFGTFSYDSKKKVTNDDIYDLASATKGLATVPAVMKLVDEKKLNLQDKLSKYTPVLKGTDKANINVRQALLHESGLPAFLPYYMQAIDTSSYSGKLFNRSYTAIYKAEFGGTWARTDYKFKPELISTKPQKGYDLKIADNLYANNSYSDTLLQMIADADLRRQNRYLYSCLNFMLLKEAVEEISKEDLNSFLQKNFYAKLGASTTTYNPLTKFDKEQIAPTERDNFLRKQLVQGYVHDEGAAMFGGISGNAGLFSNANDIAKICQMLLYRGEYGGEQYLSAATCRTFTISKSGISRRGLGFDKPDVKSMKASPCSPSTPVTTYGHTGFTGTCFWVDPDNNLIFIFLSNRVNETRENKKLMTMNIRGRIQEQLYVAMGKQKQIAEKPVTKAKTKNTSKAKTSSKAKPKTSVTKKK